jgi:hypothetical protein
MKDNNTPEGIILNKFSQVYPLVGEAGSKSLNQWALHDYETTNLCGVMLIARNNVQPAPIRIPADLSGWHRIHVCMYPNNTATGKSMIALKLTDDRSLSFMTPGNTFISNQWQQFEKCEEFYWKSADMTGQEIILARPEPYAGVTGLMWLRFVPMDQKEVASYQTDRLRTDTRRLHAHADIDEVAFLTKWDPGDKNYALSDRFFALDEFANSDVELATFEIWVTDPVNFARVVNRGSNAICSSNAIPAADSQADLRFEGMHRMMTDHAREAGLKLFGGYRMGLSQFMFPLDLPALDDPFAKNNPQFFCRNRDGESIQFISYAYPETQEYMINNFLKTADWGYHGISLIFTRGVHILFEEPVLALFRERFGDLDPCALPFSDERLSSVLCEIMTGFMRRVRTALDNDSQRRGRGRLGINVFVYYTPQDSKLVGFDVEAWAREGLIDSAVASNMRMYEDLDGVMDDCDPAKIDLQKYTHKKLHAPDNLLRRRHGNDLERLLAGCSDYMRIAHEYNVKIYFETPWERSAPPEEMVRYALALYEKGAENFSLWDCALNRVPCRSDWNVASRLGHKDELKDMPLENSGYRHISRILSIDGCSMATYNPSWRG